MLVRKEDKNVVNKMTNKSLRYIEIILCTYPVVV